MWLGHLGFDYVATPSQVAFPVSLRMWHGMTSTLFPGFQYLRSVSQFLRLSHSSESAV